MIAKNAYLFDLHNALDIVNLQYNGNIEFKNIGDISTIKTQKCRFTLRVKNSRGPGASRNPHTGRSSIAACWHVHGHFFEALLEQNPTISIKTSLHGERTIDINGGNWQDAQAGSPYLPYNLSDACECNN